MFEITQKGAYEHITSLWSLWVKVLYRCGSRVENRGNFYSFIVYSFEYGKKDRILYFDIFLLVWRVVSCDRYRCLDYLWSRILPFRPFSRYSNVISYFVILIKVSIFGMYRWSLFFVWFFFPKERMLYERSWFRYLKIYCMRTASVLD